MKTPLQAVLSFGIFLLLMLSQTGQVLAQGGGEITVRGSVTSDQGKVCRA